MAGADENFNIFYFKHLPFSKVKTISDYNFSATWVGCRYFLLFPETP